MKIEIGESLVFSWLRHVQGCPIVQANWKRSPTWPVRREPALAADLEKLREIAGQRLGFEIFKRSSFQQFVRKPKSTFSDFASTMRALQRSPSTQHSIRLE